MPWALFNRPSIQLGALKAYIEKNSSEILVDTSHPYLEVAAMLGPDLYHWISQNPWVSEALYAPLLFPEQAESAETLALKYARKADKTTREAFHFKSLIERLEHQLQTWVRSFDWQQYRIIGFTVCFHQLLASLAAARVIKEHYPGATIVLGGSSCGHGTGQSLLQAFRFIDCIIEGEGERGLIALYHHLEGLPGTVLHENIITRQNTGKDKGKGRNSLVSSQLSSLSDLPVPDYNDYFSSKKKWFSQTPFIPLIPVEFSRGCWWNKCSFCNLNIQWCGYRYKKTAQMLHEVKTLAARHSCLDFTFVDNMLPPQESLHFFKMTGEQPPDFNFFAEIRSAKGAKPLTDIFSIYRRGGLSTIQVGIEAFSSTLLQKMQKGVSVIENIAAMRDAQENDLKLEGNLILQFPGSSPAEIAETLAVLDYVFPYRPLAGATFFLGHDSPVYNAPQKFGIRAIVNHVNSSRLMPKSTLTKINLLVKDYRGDRKYQRKIWKPVLNKIERWQQYHAGRKEDALTKPLLSYRDGGSFLLIRQELPDGRILHHRLKGSSRRIYIFCTGIKTEKELFGKFPHIPPPRILSFLEELSTKRLLFSENKKHLALAIHSRD